MSETVVKPLAGRKPTHPGVVLREDILPALGLTQAELAERLMVSRQTVSSILNGRTAVTPQMALRLGALCGNGPMLWLRMQEACSLWEARLSFAEGDYDPLRSAAKERQARD